ncbi:MAG TPA: nucleoside monophosphate kinase, partial [bacterium]|nr:nucleoside monophosphate kinase [bacterium]
ILDGFPRTAAQAEALSQLLDEENFRVIYLKASDDFLVERLSNRRVCELCGAIFHLINIPPRQPGVCDSCGGRLIQRDDDQPEVIRNRLAVYHEQTTPLLNYYRQAGRLTEVSGERPLQETLETIQQQCPW